MKLRQWYNVYCSSSEIPSPDELISCLRPRVNSASYEFESPPNWTRGFIRLSPEFDQLSIQRMRRDDEEFEAQVQRLLASKEIPGFDPIPDAIVRHVEKCVQWVHVFPMTNRQNRAARVCEQICGYLCRTRGGLIHVFQEGFFNCSGESIYPHNPVHKLKTV